MFQVNNVIVKLFFACLLPGCFLLKLFQVFLGFHLPFLEINETMFGMKVYGLFSLHICLSLLKTSVLSTLLVQ